ncbi:hypothetical protein ZYGR_0AD06540 [Zygosaccharomyces rouxii]|uniref:ZYRO0G21120p n=2 Tax=Zygosaccharomyces rouxii TaxID=4956 RepID=C5E1H9_ZYGRC|nr:uncharacterized protein ZYRO0G21120g [Zygosaccharomyces rouxii]KAH9202953.1 hypothetical protein LQ764DRAFT_72932 [Zygosaccharomyces rouxii]GAV51471.1 hypothetical protein ZYGR_0AD06540 [Zygosaccharomyces rouxii]CAR29963.1 ZYRO0G21120p [Zygosaccharomyces rouxii]
MVVSLLLDEYETGLLDGQSSKVSSHIPIRDDERCPKYAVDTKSLSLDDIDSLPLWTKFDDQMIYGSPMYLEFDDESERVLGLSSHVNKPVPCDASQFHLETFREKNPFDKLADLRIKYILASSQDAGSNPKNQLDKWFLYPKPLPKFWKYSKDRRLQDEDDSSSEEFFKDDESPRQLSYHHRNRYTGQFFQLSKYREEFDNYRERNFLKPESPTIDLPGFEEFHNDLQFVIGVVQNDQLTRLSMRRLRYLKDKFELFQDLNAKAEKLQNKLVPYRDFYNSRKVDCDFNLSGCISQRQLSEFIWDKLNTEPNRVVYKTAQGEEITLRQLFEIGRSDDDEPIAIGLKLVDDQFLEWYRDVYLITLHVIPDLDPIEYLHGQPLRFYLLAKTFLEFDNYLEGEYLAQIFIDYVITNLEKAKYQTVQVSVDFQFQPRGTPSFWERFSHWLVKWNVVSNNVRWNVRIKRVYSRLYHCDKVENFQDYLDLIFEPLMSPENLEDIELQYLLSNLLNFDVVVCHSDDFIWHVFPDVLTKPKDWEAKGDNPTVTHYMYYIYAYLAILNSMRYENSLNTFTMRNYTSVLNNRTSQAGTVVDFNDQIESIVCNMLLCNGGLLQAEPLWNSQSTLSYIFYLLQIPIVATPLSSVSDLSPTPQQELKLLPPEFRLRHFSGITQSKQKTYTGNPFLEMLNVGMKVSLSSKSVLFNSSYTMDPIIEEYSVAASIYLLEAADLCELARNSVICSGYEGFYKRHWSGLRIDKTAYPSETVGHIDTWYDTEPNTSERHNVPLIRRSFRKDTLHQEWCFILGQRG